MCVKRNLFFDLCISLGVSAPMTSRIFCFSKASIRMPKLNRIKAVLADQGKTAKWLAEAIGRDRSTVSRWCTNDMQPPLEVLFQVAELLDVDVCVLLVRNK